MSDGKHDLAYFQDLWAARGFSPVSHSPEIWDERAKDWISELGPDGEGKDDMRARVAATAAYLRGRGLLGRGDTVADVGCGPGLFVNEFARTAKHATGMDYARRFLDYGAAQSKAAGLTNTSFTQCDFLALDVDAAGLAGAFDLVFTSITPAASGAGCLEKLIRMSRAYCYNASFVYARDDLAERVARDVFGAEHKSRWDGAGFYALLNLLWLSGYYPETYYYTDARDEIIEPTPENASECALNCGRDASEDAARVLEYLRRQDGEIRRRSEYRYGSVLWDVRVRHTRVTNAG
ncbi:MAG: class I SAM-dependent methyltransferase [Oscillospiraceae bacterium]|jgi:SAM-dependent methyltransferase|nr:class I SAM-dependent methyltransferase [Oscillospiraceae bacterium]